MGVTSAIIFILAASIVALVVIMSVTASAGREDYIPDTGKESKSIIRGDLAAGRTPKEDPSHVIEKIYQYPGPSGVWTCRNCECENDFALGSCCVCNQQR